MRRVDPAVATVSRRVSKRRSSDASKIKSRFNEASLERDQRRSLQWASPVRFIQGVSTFQIITFCHYIPIGRNKKREISEIIYYHVLLKKKFLFSILKCLFFVIQDWHRWRLNLTLYEFCICLASVQWTHYWFCHFLSRINSCMVYYRFHIFPRIKV